MAKLKEIIEYIKNHDYPEQNRLYDIAEDLLAKFYDESLFFKKNIDDRELLYILGKRYDYHIKISEAYDRLIIDYDKYGERAKQAERNEGIDWKAVSHAVRCLYQMVELIESGTVKYPLKEAEYLKNIKFGRRKWKEVELEIVRLLQLIGENVVNIPENNKYREIHDKIVLNCYNR